MNKLGLAFVFGLVACADKTPEVEALPQLNVETAQLQAETYIKNLFPATQVNGPICMPEAVVDQYTQCSYSMQATEGTWQVGTLLCSNLGCREGEAPTVVAAEMAPQASASATSHGMSNDWLFWYMLYNSGGTRVYYSSWYDSTPAAYRGAYYSHGYHPSLESRTYYTRTYSTPVRSASTQRFSSVTTGRPGVTRTTVPKTSGSSSTIRPSTTTPSTTRSTSTTPAPKASTPSTAPKAAPISRPMPKPAPTRSSGFRSPSRSRR